ncbi:serine/threonine-protein kinase [Rubinisphaera margarita]|uniref:serine/threonine-protein kinase n=1 Tax=Rubinisphaera margarita TaxID=2909586 RepID=UPI001EE8BC01|nr:protein kinase [Rubinisphaera margarita]MCG6156239.1 protein kinase [Rubinisphaera margarita]
MTNRSENPILLLELNQLIDRVCDQFENCWLEGGKPRIEDYLQQIDVAHHSAVLWELLALEVELRQKNGEVPGHTEYLDRFRDLSHVVDEVFRVQETAIAPTASSLAPSAPIETKTTEFAGTERFRVLQKLGQGGFGQVFKVFDELYQEECALKVLTVPEGGSLYRFKREFRTLASLHHPNLMRLKELIAERDVWFFTMELIDGVPMTRALPQPGGGAFQERLNLLIAKYFGQLLDGLEVLHSAGFIHRDLKPANVLVTREGRVVILDLGLVSTVQTAFPEWQQSIECGIAGTIAYMAPEQFQEQFSPASDMYAVGTMLFECVAGRRPFDGSALAMIEAKQRMDPPLPSDVLPTVSGALNRLCGELLQRDPDLRPDIAGMRDQLKVQSSNLTPTVRSSSPARPLLIGREGELQVLEDVSQRLDRGQPGIAFVHGLSGVGKTALVDEFLHRFANGHENPLVLSSRCYERESVPHKAFDGIIDSISRHLNRLKPADASMLLPRHTGDLARLFPVLQRVEAVEEEVKRYRMPSDFQESRRRAIHALRELLASLADRYQLVLTIDDLQWGDRDSARLLQDIFFGKDAPPLMLIATYRSDEREWSECLKVIFGPSAGSDSTTIQQQCVQIPLGELTPDDAEALAQSILGTGSGNISEAERIAREAGGSPYFIRELIRHKQCAGDNFNTLDEAIISRVQNLEPCSRQLLELIALNGQPLPISEAVEAARTRRSHLDVLRDENFVRTSGSTGEDYVECYHDRIRESVSTIVDELRRREIHQSLAATLIKTSRVDAQTLGRHYEAAGLREQAVDHYQQAAEAATGRLAFDQAARLYQRILELTETAEPQERSLAHERVAEAYARDGQGEKAAEHYELAAGLAPDSDRQFELNRLAMMRLFQVGKLAKAHRLLESLLSDVSLSYPRTMSQVVRGILQERLLQSRQIRPVARLFRRRTEKVAVQRMKTCWAAAQSLSILDPIRGCYFQHVGERENEAAPHLVEAHQLQAYGACLVAATGKPSDIARSRQILQELRTSPHYSGAVYVETFVEMCEGAIDYLTSDFDRAIERCTHAMSSYLEHCPEAWWEADLSRMFALFSANFSGNVVRIHQLTSIDPQTQSKRDTTYYDLMIRGVSEIVRDMASDDFRQTDRRTQDLARLLDFNEFNNLHFNYYLRHLWELRYQQEHRLCWETTVRIEKPFRSALLQSHHWSRHAYSLHRAGAAIGTLAATQQSREGSQELTARLHEDAQKHIRKLRREASRCCAAEADLLEAGLLTFQQKPERTEIISRLKRALAGFREVKLAMYEAICHDRLARLGQTESARTGTDEARNYVRDHGIVNSDRFFAVFSPGRWT